MILQGVFTWLQNVMVMRCYEIAKRYGYEMFLLQIKLDVSFYTLLVT